jgi:hypothetical protein
MSISSVPVNISLSKYVSTPFQDSASAGQDVSRLSMSLVLCQVPFIYRAVSQLPSTLLSHIAPYWPISPLFSSVLTNLNKSRSDAIAGTVRPPSSHRRPRPSSLVPPLSPRDYTGIWGRWVRACWWPRLSCLPAMAPLVLSLTHSLPEITLSLHICAACSPQNI